ncbi:MAG TPA: hypothetical protein VGX76_21585 [Pirellulales bacterium]|nr:hypothetical protein [Pirellulales bacterium]
MTVASKVGSAATTLRISLTRGPAVGKGSRGSLAGGRLVPGPQGVPPSSGSQRRSLAALLAGDRSR